MNHLTVESLSELIYYFEDIFTARNYCMVCRNTKKSFELLDSNTGYSLLCGLTQTDEDENEMLIQKRFEQELSLFSNRKQIKLTKETMQLLPTVTLPVILPPLTSKFINFYLKMGMNKTIHRATIKYVISCVEDRLELNSLEPFKQFNYLHIIIDDIYRVEFHKIISKQMKIQRLRITIKMAADFEPSFFNEFNEYQINKLIVICKRKQEIDKLKQISSIINNSKIQICSRFWYRGIDPSIVLIWKPNLIYMTEDGVVEAEVLQKYYPWNMKFVEIPLEEDEIKNN